MACHEDTNITKTQKFSLYKNCLDELVWSGLLDMVDNKKLNRHPNRLEFQPELFLNRSKH